MRIDKKIKDAPWPEGFEAELQHFRVMLSWPVINHEKMLVATFQRNRKRKHWGQVTPDFRLVCSKKNKTAAVIYQGERVSKRIGLKKCLSGIDVSATSGYPEISEQDEKSLGTWLGTRNRKTSNHYMVELSDWVDEAISSETQREKDARGELRDEDVKLCPEDLPAGLVEYIQRCILPNDEVLIYKKGNVRGTCYLCREKVRAVGGLRFKQHQFTNCPNCGRKVTAHLEGSDSFKADYVENIVALQKGTNGKTVFLRQWHLLRDPTAQWEDIPAHLEEIGRYAIRGNRVAKWQMENKENMYYVSYRYRYADWQRIQSVSVVYDNQYYFYLPEDWQEQIAGTSLQYCNIEEYNAAAFDYGRGQNCVRFLMDWVRYPAIEKLWKAGYTGLVNERIAGLTKDTQYTVRWNQNSIQSAIRFPARLLKIYAPSDWTMHDAAKVTELWAQVEAGEIKEADLPELARSAVSLDHIRDALGHASIHKILQYMGRCMDKERKRRCIEAEEARKKGHYYWRDRPSDSPNTYRDYLKDCIKLHLNLDDKAVLFPPDLDAAHSRTIAQVKHRANELSREAFQREVQRLSWMEWEKDGLLIRLPIDGDELTAEGAYLHHCVGGYVDRMANGKTTILLIRKVEAPDTPFYTLEWLDGRVQQCRTTHNGDYARNPEVKAFVDTWVKKVASKGKKKQTSSAAQHRRKKA